MLFPHKLGGWHNHYPIPDAEVEERTLDTYLIAERRFCQKASVIMINQPVRLREGVNLHLKAQGSSFVATLILSRSGNLSQIFAGKLALAEAFRLAEEESRNHGFNSYYDVSGPEDWPVAPAAEYGQAGEEIMRQLGAVRSRGGSFGGMLPEGGPLAWGAAQEHIGRLDRLQQQFYGFALQ